MLVLTHQILCFVISTSDQCLVSFRPILCHPHTQIRIILFHDVQRDILNFEFSPIHVSIGFSQIAFPICPATGWPYKFLSRRTTGSSILDHDLGHLCRGIRIQMSEHSDFGVSIICEHLPFSLGYKPILRLLLVHRNLAIWRWYPWSWRLSFEMLKILVQWILRKTLNRLLQYHHGVQLDLCISLVLPPIQHFLDDKSFNDAKWTVATDVLASSITSFLLLTFVKFHAEIFSNFSHSVSTAALAAGIFMAWGKGINLWTKFKKIAVNCLPFLQYGLHDDSVKTLPYAVWWIHWLPKYTQILIWSLWIYPGSPHADCSCLSCKA